MYPDISELDGLNDLRPQTRAHLAAQGIRTLAQLAALSEAELRRFKGIGPVKAQCYRAQARAYLEGRPVWTQPLPSVLDQPAWFFDIETIPYAPQPLAWSIGVCAVDGPVHLLVVHPFVARRETFELPGAAGPLTLVPEPEELWRALADLVRGDQQPLLHWTGFDAGVMRGSAPREVVEELDERLHDQHASFKRCLQIGTRGTSIKKVSAYFGFHYAAYEDWSAAWRDYQRWLATGEEIALRRACAYQADDVLAMRIVWRRMREG